VKHVLLPGVHLEIAQQHLLGSAAELHLEDRRVNASFFSAKYKALWSSSIIVGVPAP